MSAEMNFGGCCVAFLHAGDREDNIALGQWAFRWQKPAGRRARVETRRGRAGIALYEEVEHA